MRTPAEEGEGELDVAKANSARDGELWDESVSVEYDQKSFLNASVDPATIARSKNLRAVSVHNASGEAFARVVALVHYGLG